MNDKLNKVKEILESLLYENKEKFDPPYNKAPLVTPNYSIDEIMEVIDSLITSDITMGEKTKHFENLFAEKLGVKYALMVNSGSSANLLAAFSIINQLYSKKLQPGDEVIVPSLTWPTTIYPFVQAGLTPVLVDIEKDTLNMNPDLLEQALSQKTKAICTVHILGNPANMLKIKKFADKHNLLLIEDTCEAIGSKFNNVYCGTFGDIGTFSFYFSHHITTIEGGMITTNNEELYEIMLEMRSHGWTRHLPNPEKYEKLYPTIDNRYLFINTGFNLRPTDIQASFGIHQIKKLDEFNMKRREAAKLLINSLKDLENYIYLTKEMENTYHTWFGFPFLVKRKSKKSKSEVIKVLEEKNISTRPVVGGNLALQPAFDTFNYKISGDLQITNMVHNDGIYIGIHPKTTAKTINYISETFHEIFN